MSRPPGSAVWLVVLLSIPAVSLALGARQPLMDHRAKTAWPSVRATALLHKQTYQQLDAAWLERLPPREQAVRVHARLSVGVFGESSNPYVAVGRNGWLYYTLGLRTCRDARPTVDPADAVEITAATIIASGRRALIVEPAEKMLVHPADAPRYPRGVAQCVAALQRSVARRLATIEGGVDFDARLRRMEAAGQSTFLPHDSHWNYRGRLAFARLVLDFIAPGLSRATGLHAGQWLDHHSDLYLQLGLSATDRDRAVLLKRALRQPAGAGRTVILGDSQMGETFKVPPAPGAPPMATQLPADTVVCPSFEDFLHGTCDEVVDGASAIVVESVGRNLRQFESTCSRLVALLGQPLRGADGHYALLDGGASQAGDRITFGSDGKAVLRVLPRHGDVSRDARLLRIPIESLPDGASVTMTQRPRTGRATPCSTQGVGAPGASLILPLPAGRSASEIVVELDAPPGTALGAPQEVPLTGAVARSESP